MLFSPVIRCHPTIKRSLLAGLAILTTLTLAAGQATTSNGDTAKKQAQLRDPLRCGGSSFVIQLKKLNPARCLTFVNENAPAEGRMSIAVSDRALAPDSPAWKAVAGSVPFRHKRRFPLSLVGVEANYVRLTFEVDRAPKVAGLD